MSDKKKILLVDDNYESIDFFKSMLEIMDQRFTVVSTPSAEEGWLEFRRGNFDLLVTDLRLPGMSGRELIEQVLASKPGFPTILISGYERDRLKAEVADLDVYAYLEKPYDTGHLLQLIQAAVFGEEAVPAADPLADDGSISGELVVPKIELEISSDIIDTLSNLKFYTGGEQVLLGLLNGQLLHQLEESSWLDFESFSEYLAGITLNSVLLAQALRDEDAQSIHNLEAKGNVIFTANVGQRYYLSLFLDNRSERGRLGVIWVAIQRVVKELMNQLPQVDNLLGDEYFTPAKTAVTHRQLISAKPESKEKGAKAVAAKSRPPQASETTAPEVVPAAPTEKSKVEEPEFVPLSEPIIDDALLSDLLDSTEWEVESTAPAFWDEQIKQEGETQSGHLLSFEDALQQGFINSSEPSLSPEPVVSDAELEKIIPEEEDWESDQAIDSFWDSLIETTGEEPKSEGAMSLEEARKQGLLGKQFDQE